MKWGAPLLLLPRSAADAHAHCPADHLLPSLPPSFLPLIVTSLSPSFHPRFLSLAPLPQTGASQHPACPCPCPQSLQFSLGLVSSPVLLTSCLCMCPCIVLSPLSGRYRCKHSVSWLDRMSYSSLLPGMVMKQHMKAGSGGGKGVPVLTLDTTRSTMAS